jgi:hypothetical protein
MWKSMADAAAEIEGDRTNNNAIHHSLKSPDDSKLQVKGWYLFRTKPTDWTPAERKGFTSESAKNASKISNKKRMKPVYGISITTGETVEFNSISAASFFIKGEGNYKGVGNIMNNIQRIKNGETWRNSYGYRWYEKA